MGILFALGALFAWAFGDFFIQRTTRLIGIWKALFFIGLFGAFGFLPFVIPEFALLDKGALISLASFSVFVVGIALVDFQAMYVGKLAVVQPIISLELVWTVLLSVAIGHEILDAAQALFIFLILAGLLLSSVKRRQIGALTGADIEKGIFIALAASIGMGAINFFFGVNSQNASPWLTVWSTHTVAFIAAGAYLSAKGQISGLWADLRRHPATIFWMSLLDNVSWLCFGFAATYIAISVATAISETYIALTVLLGIFINRERLQTHQYLGIALAVAGVIALSIYV